MADALRAELLKARSGFWLLAVLAFALLLPLFAWKFTGSSIDLDGSDSATATRQLLGFLGLCPLAASFLGCYLVTREYYYKSIERTVLLHRRIDTFAAKCVAGAVGGLAVGVIGAGGWSLVVGLVLNDHQLVFDAGTQTWLTLICSVLACVFAGAFGIMIGWILPNYYQATGVSLMLPMVVEVPLLLLSPDVARFLPNTAFAAIARTPVPGLFSVPVSVAIVLVWLAVVAFTGWRLFARREIR